ncbi:hypothetical protein LINPERPRIM_LOCUS3428 [Linum perenne]
MLISSKLRNPVIGFLITSAKPTNFNRRSSDASRRLRAARGSQSAAEFHKRNNQRSDHHPHLHRHFLQLPSPRIPPLQLATGGQLIRSEEDLPLPRPGDSVSGRPRHYNSSTRRLRRRVRVKLRLDAAARGGWSSFCRGGREGGDVVVGGGGGGGGGGGFVVERVELFVAVGAAADEGGGGTPDEGFHGGRSVNSEGEV